MAVEVVLLVPVLLLVLMLVVAFGRYADRKGDVEAIARDAARAASFERSTLAAQDAAASAVAAAEPHLLGGASCSAPTFSGSVWDAGGQVIVRVSCELSWDGLAPLGLPGTVNMTASASSPIDTFRRWG